MELYNLYSANWHSESVFIFAQNLMIKKMILKRIDLLDELKDVCININQNLREYFESIQWR